MWSSDIKTEYLIQIIKNAIEDWNVSASEDAFSEVLTEFQKSFPQLSEEDLFRLISVCIELYNKDQDKTKAEIVVTAPSAFTIKEKKTASVVPKLIADAKKSITISGYSVSDYFSDSLDQIIDKSGKGVYVRFYLNDSDGNKESLKRVMAYRSKYLRVFQYQKSEDDKMAALHAKLLVVDGTHSLLSSANLSYHGMKGNIEMGFLVHSAEQGRRVEDFLKEIVRMRVFAEIE